MGGIHRFPGLRYLHAEHLKHFQTKITVTHYGCPIHTQFHRGWVGSTDFRVYDTLMPSNLKRFQTEGHDHFITFSCYQRLPYLNTDKARTTFLEILEAIRQRHQLYVFGYVLMPEHVHLLLSEPKAHSLSTMLNVLKGETSKCLKGIHKQFWLSRYHDFNVLTHKKFVEKLRYIHRNPVARGLVEKPEDWEWSSYRHWLTGEAGPIEIESHWTFAARERRAIPPITMKP